MNCAGGTCGSTFAAANALCRLRIFDRIDVHPADVGAFAAVHALVFIHRQTIEAYFIEQAVDCAERTDEFAEKAIDNDTAYDGDDQQSELPIEEPANCLLKLRVRAQQWNAAHQRAGRTDVLAECRFAHAYDIGDSHRHDTDKNDQNDVFEILRKRRQTQFFLGQRNLGKELLNQTKRTQETTYEAAQQYANCKQKSYNIEAEIKFPGAGNGLKRADGAGNGSGRAGVTVQTWIAELLPGACIDPGALFTNEVAGMQIGETESCNLNQFAFDMMIDFHERLPQSYAFKADVDRLFEHNGNFAAIHAICDETYGGDANKNARSKQQNLVLFHMDTPVYVTA